MEIPGESMSEKSAEKTKNGLHLIKIKIEFLFQIPKTNCDTYASAQSFLR